jgi:hypothetical protein
MKKSLSIAAVIAIIILAAGAAYTAFHNSSPAPAAVAPSASTTAPQIQPANPTSTVTTSPTAFAWEFKDAGTDQAAQAPLTTVSIKKMDGSVRTIGTYQGSCATIDGTSWSLLQGESSGVICWWAGGGTELGAFNESGTTVIKSGGIDEGSEEDPGVRGNFKTLFSL